MSDPIGFSQVAVFNKADKEPIFIVEWREIGRFSS